MGASGLCASTFLYPRKAVTDPGVAWKLILIASFMVLSNVLLAQFFLIDDRLYSDASIPIVSMAGYLIGGLLVGFGTRLANGCTTGHGICGMARLSKRSFMAVGAFMFAAVGTANLVAPDFEAIAEYTAFLRTDKPYALFNRYVGIAVTAPILLASLYALYNLRKACHSINCGKEESASPDQEVDPEQGVATNNDAKEDATPESSEPELEVEPKVTATKKTPNRNERVNILDGANKIKPAILSGLLFATGLAVSGMVLPSKLIGFLNLWLLKHGTWDPTLMTVMAGGSIVSWISYQFVSGHGIISNSYAMSCPSRSSTFAIPDNKTIDFQLIFGSLCFGAGWGVAGLCPGPAMFMAASGTVPVIAFWWPMFFVGTFIAQKIKDRS